MPNETLNEDPIVVYIIVREELHMSTGKIASQVGHSIQKLLLHYFAAQLLCACKKRSGTLPKAEEDRVNITSEWINNNSRKVVLKASEKEWTTIKSEFGKNNSIIVIDNGLTEVEPGSETVICLYPEHKSLVSKTIRRLSVL